jgi:hypothetical protein
MSELSWKAAVIKILETSKKPMHYTAIADSIAKQKLKTKYGATPANSVNTAITLSLNKEPKESPFIRLDAGIYGLRDTDYTTPVAANDEDENDTGLINAFGMYWNRNKVMWDANPKLWGKQQAESALVDFCTQKGVYLLHDGRSVIYVGRAIEQPLGIRLRQHLVDRLNGRWDRFSWFGVYPVSEAGGIEADPAAIGQFSMEMLIITMEALLIEGLEPPQNRKRGDEFKAIEFIQEEDPKFEKVRNKQAIEKLIQSA